MLAGGVGAIAGGARGGRKVEPYVTVTYKDEGGNERQWVLITKAAKKLKKKLDKRYKLAV